MDAASITCTPERATAPASGVDDAPITDVMDTGVLCVDMDARVESVASALDDHDAPLAVVIDRHGHAVGICSRRDLVSRAPTQRVETCMTPFLITMLESAKVADAIEAIVDRGLNHVPVLSEGRVLGLITPRAVIRWMAQRLRAPRSAHARRGSEG
jgi:signal-transduction protein with cAMP-binding, CBS, and nucleotidyltransferase domain